MRRARPVDGLRRCSCGRGCWWMTRTWPVALAERFGLDRVDLSAFAVDAGAAERVTVETGLRYDALPVAVLPGRPVARRGRRPRRAGEGRRPPAAAGPLPAAAAARGHTGARSAAEASRVAVAPPPLLRSRLTSRCPRSRCPMWSPRLTIRGLPGSSGRSSASGPSGRASARSSKGVWVPRERSLQRLRTGARARAGGRGVRGHPARPGRWKRPTRSGRRCARRAVVSTTPTAGPARRRRGRPAEEIGQLRTRGPRRRMCAPRATAERAEASERAGARRGRARGGGRRAGRCCGRAREGGGRAGGCRGRARPRRRRRAAGSADERADAAEARVAAAVERARGGGSRARGVRSSARTMSRHRFARRLERADAAEARAGAAVERAETAESGLAAAQERLAAAEERARSAGGTDRAGDDERTRAAEARAA